ncbi:hypothetical protein SAMN04487773_0980 [Enterobacter sp. kpr-6]|uniref:hypothetical protein n=1 Tax=Enterobacter sp. kpr-6 TaxID=1761782 RepID=UPI0008E9B505|nr:hypothetical protein [Enterobacter sp. kpr-6]SFR00819.1 hypothetical protein SAMN04487773_0980 [Enterobacter sp. kpr-6]
MKEQLANMTIIELVRTAHSYAASIQTIETYSAIVTELGSRLEALNLAHIAAMNNLRSVAMLSAAPVNPELTTHLVGEVVAWHHPNHERNVDFRWLDFNVEPGTKLYAIKQERN